MKTITVAINNVKDIPHEVFKDAAEMLAHKIINRTPVDTGLLANSWVPTLNRPSKRVIKTVDKTKKKPRARVSQVVSRMPEDNKFFLTNNQMYAGIIEMGRREGPPATGSNLAPLGMARITAAEWDSIVRMAAEKYR
jgi:hypothetical protein